MRTLHLGLEARLKPPDPWRVGPDVIEPFTLVAYRTLAVPRLKTNPAARLADRLERAAAGMPLLDCSAFWRNRALRHAAPSDIGKPGLLLWLDGRPRVMRGTQGVADFLELHAWLEDVAHTPPGQLAGLEHLQTDLDASIAKWIDGTAAATPDATTQIRYVYFLE